MNLALVVTLVCAVALVAGRAAGQQTAAPGPPSRPAVASPEQEPAVKAFQDAVARYMTLRLRIANEVPPHAVTPKAAEISARSDAQARALQRARRTAKQGEFFSASVVRIIQQRLNQSLSSAERAHLLSSGQEEPRPRLVTPRIHGRFPEGDVLATTPSGALQGLPPLPAGLEYRFIGNVLVLRDIDAALILDYMSPAVR